MDDPKLDDARHVSALRGLRRINRLTRSHHPIWKKIRQVAQRQSHTTVLDIGCGGGDTLARLGVAARTANLDVSFSGLDVSATAIRTAEEMTQRVGVTAEFFQRNILRERIPGKFDVVYCSLFLHHFSDEDAVRLLNVMSQSTRRLLIVSDLRRSYLGYAYSVLGTRLFSRSRIVHVDGPRSVEAAFTVEELSGICRQCGLKSISIERFWPQRFLLTWTAEL